MSIASSSLVAFIATRDAARARRLDDSRRHESGLVQRPGRQHTFADANGPIARNAGGARACERVTSLREHASTRAVVGSAKTPDEAP